MPKFKPCNPWLLLKEPERWPRPKPKFQAREARDARCTSGTPQRPLAEAQRRSRVCGAV